MEFVDGVILARDAYEWAKEVELCDGRRVDSRSADWKQECLARWVLSLKPLAKRQAWLFDFEKRHGPEETERLKANMTKVWEKK